MAREIKNESSDINGGCSSDLGSSRAITFGICVQRSQTLHGTMFVFPLVMMTVIRMLKGDRVQRMRVWATARAGVMDIMKDFAGAMVEIIFTWVIRIIDLIQGIIAADFNSLQLQTQLIEAAAAATRV